MAPAVNAQGQPQAMKDRPPRGAAQPKSAMPVNDSKIQTAAEEQTAYGKAIAGYPQPKR